MSPMDGVGAGTFGWPQKCYVLTFMDLVLKWNSIRDRDNGDSLTNCWKKRSPSLQQAHPGGGSRG